MPSAIKACEQENGGAESYSMKIDPSADSQKLSLPHVKEPESPPTRDQSPLAGLSEDFSNVL